MKKIFGSDNLNLHTQHGTDYHECVENGCSFVGCLYSEAEIRQLAKEVFELGGRADAGVRFEHLWPELKKKLLEGE